MLGKDIIKYIDPITIEDFEDLVKKLNPNKFLKDMIDCKELDEITNNYSYDCCQLCHNSIAWALKQLHGSLYFYSIEVAYGRFVFGEHSWLKLGDYYIDLTLAQFRNEAPKIAITLVTEGIENGYRPSSITSADEWIKEEMKNI